MVFFVVGSSNPVKVRAFQKALLECKFFPFVSSVEVVSSVAAQPFGLEEIVRGARHRAECSFRVGCVGVGIESGMFQVGAKYFNTCHVALCDGVVENGLMIFYEGGSQYFEIPSRLAKVVIETGKVLGDFYDGKGDGAIGVLTGGVMTREKQVCCASIMAICRYAKKVLYE